MIGIYCSDCPLNEPEDACHLIAASVVQYLLFKMFWFVSRDKDLDFALICRFTGH